MQIIYINFNDKQIEIKRLFLHFLYLKVLTILKLLRIYAKNFDLFHQFYLECHNIF